MGTKASDPAQELFPTAQDNFCSPSRHVKVKTLNEQVIEERLNELTTFTNYQNVQCIISSIKSLPFSIAHKVHTFSLALFTNFSLFSESEVKIQKC